MQFSRGEAKPVLALRILDDLFSSPTDQKYIFSKNVDDLQSLLKLLSRIKVRNEIIRHNTNWMLFVFIKNELLIYRF